MDIMGMLTKAYNKMKSAGKQLGKIANRAYKSKAGKWVRTKTTQFKKRMAQNFTSRKWWAKAVRRTRAGIKFFGVLGAVGAALSRAGGFGGMLGKGLSIFQGDYRSPKEFRKDQKRQVQEIDKLKIQQKKLLDHARKVQEELRKPVVFAEGSSTDEKVVVLAEHLSQMKNSLADIQGDTIASKDSLATFHAQQKKANTVLADAIDFGTQTNMKTTLAGIEDSKNVTKEAIASSTQAVVGELGSQISAMEQRRKDEIEFRKKNNWKVKLFKFILFIADWALNWKRKLTLAAIKLGIVITAAIAGYMLKHLNTTKAIYNSGWKNMSKMLLTWIAKTLLRPLLWVKKIVGNLGAWIIKKIASILTDLRWWLLEKLSGLPVVGKFFKAQLDYEKSIAPAVAEKFGEAVDKIAHAGEGIAEKVLKWLDKTSKDQLKDAKKKYELDKKKNKSDLEKKAKMLEKSKDPKNLIGPLLENDMSSPPLIKQGKLSTSQTLKEKVTEVNDDDIKIKSKGGVLELLTDKAKSSLVSGLNKAVEIDGRYDISDSLINGTKKTFVAIDKNSKLANKKIHQTIKDVSKNSEESSEKILKALEKSKEIARETQEYLVGKEQRDIKRSAQNSNSKDPTVVVMSFKKSRAQAENIQQQT